MKTIIPKIYRLLFACLVLSVWSSCSEDANNDQISQELSQTEVQTILSADEITGVADNALTELFAANSAAGKTSKSNDCYSAEYSDTGFTATFNNCVLNGTDNVNGTLTVVYEVGENAASFTATYVDFYVGNIKINGTRNFAIVGNFEESTASFDVTSNLTIEMEDGSTIVETGTKTFGITFGTEIQDSSFTISGSWTVQIDGNTYTIETVEDLQSSLDCVYVTSGSMNIIKNGLQVTVDFGNGDCDDKATLIYPNGATEEITL